MWQLAEDLTGPCTERCAHPGHGKPQLLHVLVRQVLLPSVRPSQVNFSEQIVPSLLLESRRDGARATGPQHQIWSRLCHRDPGLACGARSAAGRRPILGAAFGLAAGASDVCCRGSKILSRPSPSVLSCTQAGPALCALRSRQRPGPVHCMSAGAEFR